MNKKASSNASDRANSHILTGLVESMLRMGRCLHSSYTLSAEGQVTISPHFQGRRAISAPVKVTRILGAGEGKYTFRTSQTADAQGNEVIAIISWKGAGQKLF